MRHHRLTRSATLGLALVAFVAPTAAPAQDLRTPDARDAYTISPAPSADLRSPDTRHTSTNVIASVPRDLRTADARDAAEGRDTFNAPQVEFVEVPQHSPAVADGMDWGDAGIGAGTLLVVILLGLGSVLAVMHRRHGAPAQHETAIG